MKRILITGGNGLLGSTLIRAWGGIFQVHGTYRSKNIVIPHSQAHRVDVTNRTHVQRLMKVIRPDWVIHTAAVANVDGCETDFELAYQTNILGSEIVAQTAKTYGARLVHVSTDMVFDGLLRKPYTELNMPRPINVYAMTKAVAEKRVAALYPQALIVRTAFWGWNVQDKLSLAEYFLKQLVAGKKVWGTNAQTSSLGCADVADILLALMRKRARGIYHVGSRKAVTKYRLAGLLARQFRLSADKISRRTVAQMRFEARRPIYLALDVHKTEKLLGYSLPTTDQSVKRFYEEKATGWVKRLKML